MKHTKRPLLTGNLMIPKLKTYKLKIVLFLFKVFNLMETNVNFTILGEQTRQLVYNEADNEGNPKKTKARG